MGDTISPLLARKPSTAKAPLLRAAGRGPERVASRVLRTVQPVLKVGAANDPLEHEADRMAERVVAMPEPSRAAPPDEESYDAGREAKASRFPKVDQESQPDTDTFESAPAVPSEHQDPEVSSAEDVDTGGMPQDEFAEVESGEPTPPQEDTVQPAMDGPSVGAAGGEAPQSVARKVAQPGAGRPLPHTVRQFMEPRFGVSFEDVRIHDGNEDRKASDAIGARAFTHRQHIWLGEGESVEDRKLLAHELTHVVQQTKRPSLEGDTANARREDASAQRSPAEPQIRRGYLADKAESIARNVPGYFLLTVILGKSPITGDAVPRTAENLVGGFLGLLPGGNLIFERLKETRALTDAFDWISTRLSQLNITWSRVKRLISEFIDEMPAWHPVRIAKRIFGPLVNDVITFVGEIKDKILEFIFRGALKLAGSWGEKVWGVIQQGREAISLILNDPLGFAKNLISAVVGGFKKFGANIWKHLKAGLMGWLFGTLQGMEITLPDKLDFKGILSVALQIVGLTYANFRAILVKKLGKGGEKKVRFIEKSVEVVRILLKEGFTGIWQRVLQSIDGFKQTVIEGIRNFVMVKLVEGAISWVAGLSNPVGAIVKLAISIYNMIKTFLERLDQIIEIASSIFSSITAIAKGQTTAAIDLVEKTIARTIPVFLGFVAALIPVTGITNAIRNIIKNLQSPVKMAMEKIVGFLVKKAKKLFAKLLGKVNKKRKIAKKGFVIGEEAHELIPEQSGKTFGLKIASGKAKDSDKAQTTMKSEVKKAAEFGDDSKCVAAFAEAFQLEIDKAEKGLRGVNAEETKKSTKQPAANATKAVDDASKKLTALGKCIADNPFLEDRPTDGEIIRAREPRIPEVEGDADLYGERGKVTSQKIAEVAKKAKLGAKGAERLSNYYENDHVPEKDLAKKVSEFLLGPYKDAVDKGERAGRKIPDPALGTIDALVPDERGTKLPAITIYRPTHRQKTAQDSKRRDNAGIINAAKAKTTPLQMVDALRSGISKEMKTELKELAEIYSADQAATKEIRAKFRAGMGKIGDINKELFGVKPGQAPAVKEGKDGAEGSDLPFGGDPKSGLPDFSNIEGRRYPYSKGPKNAGLYIELDHVVEASLGEKARDLTFSHPALVGGLKPAIKAGAAKLAKEEKAAARAMPDDGKKKEAADEPDKSARTAEQIEQGAEARLAGLNAVVIPAAQPYKRETAGTIALYRPVHREVTYAQKDIKGPIIEAKDVGGARSKLVEHALATDDGKAPLDEAAIQVKAAVRAKFEETMASHIGLIQKAYQEELKQFIMLNQASKPAAAKMAAVIEQVGGTLRTLRSESLELVK